MNLRLYYLIFFLNIFFFKSLAHAQNLEVRDTGLNLQENFARDRENLKIIKSRDIYKQQFWNELITYLKLDRQVTSPMTRPDTTSEREEFQRNMSEEMAQYLLKLLSFNPNGSPYTLVSRDILSPTLVNSTITFYGTKIKSADSRLRAAMRIRAYVEVDPVNGIAKRAAITADSSYIELKIKDPLIDKPEGTFKWRFLVTDRDLAEFLDIPPGNYNNKKLWNLIARIKSYNKGKEIEDVPRVIFAIQKIAEGNSSFKVPSFVMTYSRKSYSRAENYNGMQMDFQFTIDRDINSFAFVTKPGDPAPDQISRRELKFAKPGWRNVGIHFNTFVSKVYEKVIQTMVAKRQKINTILDDKLTKNLFLELNNFKPDADLNFVKDQLSKRNINAIFFPEETVGMEIKTPYPMADYPTKNPSKMSEIHKHLFKIYRSTLEIASETATADTYEAFGLKITSRSKAKGLKDLYTNLRECSEQGKCIKTKTLLSNLRENYLNPPESFKRPVFLSNTELFPPIGPDTKTAGGFSLYSPDDNPEDYEIGKIN